MALSLQLTHMRTVMAPSNVDSTLREMEHDEHTTAVHVRQKCRRRSGLNDLPHTEHRLCVLPSTGGGAVADPPTALASAAAAAAMAAGSLAEAGLGLAEWLWPLWLEVMMVVVVDPRMLLLVVKVMPPGLWLGWRLRL